MKLDACYFVAMICYGDLFLGQFCLAILEVFAIRKFWILLAGRFYLVNTELWVLNLEVPDLSGHNCPFFFVLLLCEIFVTCIMYYLFTNLVCTLRI